MTKKVIFHFLYISHKTFLKKVKSNEMKKLVLVLEIRISRETIDII